jgi:hypothetical protein
MSGEGHEPRRAQQDEECERETAADRALDGLDETRVSSCVSSSICAAEVARVGLDTRAIRPVYAPSQIHHLIATRTGETETFGLALSQNAAIESGQDARSVARRSRCAVPRHVHVRSSSRRAAR